MGLWVTRSGLATDDEDKRSGGEISITIPYWIYRRICAALTAMGVSTKPEDHATAILQGHVRSLNL